MYYISFCHKKWNVTTCDKTAALDFMMPTNIQ